MSSRVPPAGVPVVDIDYYGRLAIENPTSAYRPLLDAGPIVWLSKQKVLAVARFAPLRAMLKADADFVSSEGVTMNPLLNRAARNADTVLVTDGEKHDRLRKVLMAPMRPRALDEITPRIKSQACERVDSLVGQGPFEGDRKSVV